MWEDVFTVISNLAFLLPFALAVELERIFVAFVYLFQMIDSAAYHTCNSFSGICFGLSPLFWRHSDFFWAQFIPVFSVLNLIRFPSKPRAWIWVRPTIWVLSGVLIFMLQRWIGESTWLQFGIVGGSFIGLLLYWAIYAWNAWMRDRDQESLLPPYRWNNLTLGLALSALASSLYVTEMQNHNMYWAIHSVWHVLAALGQYFLLKAWHREDFKDYSTAVLARPIAAASRVLPAAFMTRRTRPIKLRHVTPKSRV